MIVGIISDKTQKPGQTNGNNWVRTEFTIDSKKYSTFDEKIGNRFVIGDNVQVFGEMKGQYFNMKTMSLWSGSDTPEIPVVQIDTPDRKVMMANTLSTQDSIQRQCALKAAVEFQKDNENCTGEQIMATADMFVKWINGN